MDELKSKEFDDLIRPRAAFITFENFKAARMANADYFKNSFFFKGEDEIEFE